MDSFQVLNTYWCEFDGSGITSCLSSASILNDAVLDRYHILVACAGVIAVASWDISHGKIAVQELDLLWNSQIGIGVGIAMDLF